MNSTNVLAKIMKMLAFSKDDIALAGAQSEDGTIYESPNFEVGDEINTVSEDGTLTPQGKRLRATMQTFRVNNTNQWDVWIDRELVGLEDSVAHNVWDLSK